MHAHSFVAVNGLEYRPRRTFLGMFQSKPVGEPHQNSTNQLKLNNQTTKELSTIHWLHCGHVAKPVLALGATLVNSPKSLLCVVARRTAFVSQRIVTIRTCNILQLF